MVKKILKIIIAINLFIMPCLLALNIIRASSNPNDNVVIDYDYFIYYLEQFPTDTVDDIKENWGKSQLMGSQLDEIAKPESTGHVFQDIKAGVEYLAKIFAGVFNIIKWVFVSLYHVVILVFKTVYWVLMLPFDVVNYHGAV